MHRIEFATPRDVFEVRNPFIAAGERAAALSGLFAHFQQPQQRAFRREPGGIETRVGNAKHKEWFIDFQEEPLNAASATIVGVILLKSVVRPGLNMYGGFSYDTDPATRKPYTYSEVTLLVPSETNHWRPRDPSDKLYDDVVDALNDAYDLSRPDGLRTLF